MQVLCCICAVTHAGALVQQPRSTAGGAEVQAGAGSAGALAAAPTGCGTALGRASASPARSRALISSWVTASSLPVMACLGRGGGAAQALLRPSMPRQVPAAVGSKANQARSAASTASMQALLCHRPAPTAASASRRSSWKSSGRSDGSRACANSCRQPICSAASSARRRYRSAFCRA